MDKEVETLESSENVVHESGSAIPVTAPRVFDLNELQECPDKKLKTLARELDLNLHPSRSRHQHILDIARAGISSGATVNSEGFLDQVGESFAMVRWPKLNFLPLPEDVAVPRALIDQVHAHYLDEPDRVVLRDDVAVRLVGRLVGCGLAVEDARQGREYLLYGHDLLVV